MYEDRPEKDTPEAISKMLAAYGGRVPDGRPLWRLVLAQNCRMQAFGVMRHAPKVADASELDLGEVQAERVEEGAFWIPRYKLPGWVLQRWFPPQTWGTRAEWESHRAEDGVTRLRGKYPENGDYFTMAGPWDSIDAAGDLRAAVQIAVRFHAQSPTNFERYFRDELRKEKQERAEAIERYETTLEIYRKTDLLPVLKGTSRFAQKVRTEIQTRLGNAAHVGACEVWGN